MANNNNHSVLTASASPVDRMNKLNMQGAGIAGTGDRDDGKIPILT